MLQTQTQFAQWFKEVKAELLKTEPENIISRGRCLQQTVNQVVRELNHQLSLATEIKMYICKFNVHDHLQFLHSWTGLRIQANSPPKSVKDYIKRSKNWLNGRRAPNYGRTLFPFFINDAERYIQMISYQIFPKQQLAEKLAERKRELFSKIALYQIIAKLCACCVVLHAQARKAPFFCKNSIERSGKLREVLQSYAADHEYVQGFPSCYKAAIGYFGDKSKKLVQQYLALTQPQSKNRVDSTSSESKTCNSNSNTNLDGDLDSQMASIIQDPGETQTRTRTQTQTHDVVSSLQQQVQYWQQQTHAYYAQLLQEQQKRYQLEQRLESLVMKHHIDQQQINLLPRLILTNDQPPSSSLRIARPLRSFSDGQININFHQTHSSSQEIRSAPCSMQCSASGSPINPFVTNNTNLCVRPIANNNNNNSTNGNNANVSANATNQYWSPLQLQGQARPDVSTNIGQSFLSMESATSPSNADLDMDLLRMELPTGNLPGGSSASASNIPNIDSINVDFGDFGDDFMSDILTYCAPAPLANDSMFGIDTSSFFGVYSGTNVHDQPASSVCNPRLDDDEMFPVGSPQNSNPDIFLFFGDEDKKL